MRCLLAGVLASTGSSLFAQEEAQEETPAEPESEAGADVEEAEEPEPLSPEEMFEGGTETFENWVELSVGGVHVDGNDAQFQQRHRIDGNVFGGIQDLHYQHAVGEDKMFSLDGRALFDQHDYSVTLELSKPEAWYTRFRFENFRTWSNDDGGYYPPTDTQYSRGDDALALDRGEISFEAGLTLENIPALTFKYTHRYRDGDKASTIWGPTHPTLFETRGLSPSFAEINERIHIFELMAKHQIKSTDVGLGLRYETADLDNARKTTFWPGEGVIERRLTDREEVKYDLLNVHAFTETWLKENLFFTTGFLFSDICSDFSGSRIYGDDFDVGYVQNPNNGRGYFGLDGSGRLHEYVGNVNLMAKVTPHLTIVPSLRIQKEDWGADSMGMQTTTGAGTAFTADSDGESLDVRERLDIRYTGVTNWVFYLRGEWTQGEGELNETGGVVPSVAARESEDTRLFQKYLAGTKWYAAKSFSVGAEGYYKINSYEYDHSADSTANGSGNRYPAYLTMQDFETLSGRVRMNWRAHRTLSFATLYEHQRSTVNTEPDSASGLGDVESSEMTRHIVGLNASWTPWSRLFVQPGINYVWSETETPAADATSSILDAQNNYWTVNLTTGFVIDDKTDLSVGYFLYRSDNYTDNSADGVPYGMEATEHSITVGVTRRLSERIRVNLRYGFSDYEDTTSGGNNDYQAHFLFSSLQYRF